MITPRSRVLSFSMIVYIWTSSLRTGSSRWHQSAICIIPRHEIAVIPVGLNDPVDLAILGDPSLVAVARCASGPVRSIAPSWDPVVRLPFSSLGTVSSSLLGFGITSRVPLSWIDGTV